MKSSQMKIVSPLLIHFFLLATLRADIPVVDPTHIAISEREHTVSYVQRAEQIARQVEGIRQLARQIHQMDVYLKRMGDPASFVDLPGTSTLLRSLEDGVRHAESESAKASLYDPISTHVMVQGQPRGLRDAQLYRPEHAAEDAFARYWETHRAARERRTELREAILASTRNLQEAESASEVSKIHGVLLGFQLELNALEQELQSASQEALLRFLENENQRQLESKARREDEIQASREGMRRTLDRFQLPFTTDISSALSGE